MIGNLILTLGALTIGGGIAVVVFALASRVSRSRYAARWRCWLWLFLCLRLIMPFSLFSLIEAEEKAPIRIEIPLDDIVYEYVPALPVNTPPVLTPTTRPDSSPVVSGGNAPVITPSGNADSPPITPNKPAFKVSLLEIVTIIWIAGAVVMAVWLLVSHLRFLKYLRRWGKRVEDADTIRLYNNLGNQLNLDRRPNLRICAGLRAPMLAGLIHPMLLLPEEGIKEGLKYVLLHELTHFKRRDIWLKAVALLANVVHWFNPLMWYMVRLIERDTELACDEASLRQLSAEEHGEYGRTILSAVERLRNKAAKED